jgi:hypothetical protein
MGVVTLRPLHAHVGCNETAVVQHLRSDVEMNRAGHGRIDDLFTGRALELRRVDGGHVMWLMTIVLHVSSMSSVPTKPSN